MPHTYVILISIMVLMLVLTHIIPAGEYDRVEDPVSGKMVVVADSYHEIDVEAPGIFDLFLALQEGYVDAADIMFLIIFAYGFVYVLTKNGTMDAALGTMVRKIGSRVSLLIPITMLVLGILGSTMGIYEEVYGLSQLLNASNKMLSAVGMLFLQNVINFFITGSSSQATITMPIMTPVADIVGVSRQTAVLAYCFGDGFSDMFWPTACTLNCGLMGVPLDRWYRFMAPLFLIMMALQTFFIALSVFVYP